MIGQDSVPVGQHGLAEGADNALIGGHEPRKALHQILQQPDLLRPGGQQGKVGCHITLRGMRCAYV